MSTLQEAEVTSLDLEGIQKQIAALNWMHTIDLGNGLKTPGKWGPPNPMIWQVFDDIDFRGKKVLDIGCWDGLWAFEAERRGASQIYATDCITNRPYREQPTFMLAHKLLNSRAAYIPNLSVFDVDGLGVRDFDVVIFSGIYYHLRDPLLAFARLRKVMREDAIIIVEGDAIYGVEQSFANFYYRGIHQNDVSNWWVPTIPCLRQWIESSFFHKLVEHRQPDGQRRLDEQCNRDVWPRAKRAINRFFNRKQEQIIARVVITANAVSRIDPRYAFPEKEFRDCDRNYYG